MKPNRILFLVLILLVSITTFYAQGYGKSDNPAYKKYYDSIQNMDYNRIFPIWGKQAYKKGYDMPLPYGLSAIYFTQRQEININSISVGYNGGEMADISNFIKFGPTMATTNAYTVRPDIWVFPFLNVYGILGGGTSETEVNLIAPINFETSQHFGVSSFGLGATLAGALGPFWFAWDNNYNFADIDVIVEPVPAFNSSFRIGHSFLDPVSPTKTLSIWAGVFYQSIQNDTEGSLSVESIFPNIGGGGAIQDLRDWADTLPPAQKIIMNQIIDRLEDVSNGIDTDATIDYKLDKEVAAPFNLIFGAQYQFNKNWMLRTELGVFGKRSQFLLNLNYRFESF